MSTEDEAARQLRAKRLRAEIDAQTIKHPVDRIESIPGSVEAPRDFIHRRMKEIEEEEKRRSQTET